VFLAYAAPTGSAFLDRTLYLPKGWAEDAARRAEAGVPADTVFQTKGELARAMLARAFDAGVPAAWVTGDEVYGGDGARRRWWETEHRAYALAVRANAYLWVWPEEGAPQQETLGTLAERIPSDAWVRRSCGDGAKGPRLYDWAWVAVPRWTDREGPWRQWALVRRSVADPTAVAYYLVCGPAATTLTQAVTVVGTRWVIEAGFERAKGEVGLDQYEVRRWEGWYRHITLCLLADAFLAVTRATANADAAKRGLRRR